MEIFNNREIASGIWIAIAFIATLFKSSLRTSLGHLIRSFFVKQLVILNTLLASYVVLVCFILSQIGLWDFSQLKATVLWAVFSALASLMRSLPSGGKVQPFQQWIADNIKVVVVVEFLVNFYTFPLVVELLLVPAITFLVLLLAVAEIDEKYAAVRSLLQYALAAIGILFVGLAVRNLFSDSSEFIRWSTAQDFMTPPLLSLLFIPFLLGTYWYAAYERIHVRLGVLNSIPEGLRRKAMWRAVAAFRGRIELADRWARDAQHKDIQSDEDVRQSIRRVLELYEREKDPPPVAKEEGWSPYLAANFLINHELKTGDYHQSFDEWFSASPYREVGDGLLPDNLAYYVEGNELVATTLKLVLHVNNPANEQESQAAFKICGSELLQRSTGLTEKQATAVLAGGNAETKTEYARVLLRREDFTGGIKDGYSLRLTVEVKCSPAAQAA